MLRAAGADRRIKKSRSYVTTAAGAVGGVRTEVSRGRRGVYGGRPQELKKARGRVKTELCDKTIHNYDSRVW